MAEPLDSFNAAVDAVQAAETQLTTARSGLGAIDTPLKNRRAARYEATLDAVTRGRGILTEGGKHATQLTLAQSDS